MKQIITIASTTTTDRLDKVYILLNSIKQNKKPNTKILYYLFIQFTPEYDKNYCEEYFSSLYSDDFIVLITDLDVFKREVKTKIRNHLYYAKCLFPSHFSDRILFLDVDMVFVNNGIEDLWNTDISDYYIGACIDVAWQYCPVYWQDTSNTKTKNYFNAGMILFNINKIREDKKDEELRKWCLNWNYDELKCICYDQTLLNYILKDKVKVLDFKYNNTFLSSDNACKDAYSIYLKTLGYEYPFASLDDAVLLHFSGANKPWANLPSYNYPYKEQAEKLWNTILNKYEKGVNISIFSVSDKKDIDILYVQLNSIKQNKMPDTIIHYYLIIENIDDKYKKYFQDLISYDFIIDFLEARNYEKQIHAEGRSYLYYLRCLAPRIFTKCDKIIYLDTDIIVVSNRIEEFWLTDIDDAYLAASIDIEEQFRDKKELKNVMKCTDYFNAGVMLLNLKKIREKEYDSLLAQYVLDYPKCLERTLHDQTLLNWVFQYKIKIISTDFNNSILSMRSYDEKYYQAYYKTKNLIGEVKKACILHFKGDKVWKLYNKQHKKLLPYYNLGRIIYFELYNKYAKKESVHD